MIPAIFSKIKAKIFFGLKKQWAPQVDLGKLDKD